jgi:hypothetical protein
MLSRRAPSILGGLALLALGGAVAQAHDWGFSFGFSSYPRSYCAPSAVYYDTAPVYYGPSAVYYEPPVYGDPTPRVYYDDFWPDTVVYSYPRPVYVRHTYRDFRPAYRASFYSHRSYASPRYYGPSYRYHDGRSFSGGFHYGGDRGRSFGGSFRYRR